MSVFTSSSEEGSTSLASESRVLREVLGRELSCGFRGAGLVEARALPAFLEDGYCIVRSARLLSESLREASIALSSSSELSKRSSEMALLNLLEVAFVKGFELPSPFFAGGDLRDVAT